MENTEKKIKNYNCNTCKFKTCNKTDYARHLLTRKHISKSNFDESIPKTDFVTNNCCDCKSIHEIFTWKK